MADTIQFEATITADDISRLNLTARALKIAIDGPAGAGKSTVAKRVADLLEYLYIDTGAMYRAATWFALKQNVSIDDSKAVARVVKNCAIELKPGDSKEKIHVFVNGEEVTREIRSPEITRLVSPLATNPKVRELLVDQQRKMASARGVVLDGRDIGTVVLPDADVKIFLTASAEVRAKRRLEELQQQNIEADYSELLKEIVERDERDSNRTIAPLRMAEDAVLILSDHMSIGDVVNHIIHLCLP